MRQPAGRRTTRNVCADLDAELVEFNGESDHVHLLVAYPPTWNVELRPTMNRMG